MERQVTDVYGPGGDRSQIAHQAQKVLLERRTALDNQHELIAAEADGLMIFREDRFYPFGDDPQNLVADRVPETVIDEFEVVEIDKHHGHRLSRLPADLDLFFQLVLEFLPVRQTGENIMMSEIADLAIRLIALHRDGRQARGLGRQSFLVSGRRAHFRRIETEGSQDPGILAEKRYGPA